MMKLEEIHAEAVHLKSNTDALVYGYTASEQALIAASAELKRREWLPIESAPPPKGEEFQIRATTTIRDNGSIIFHGYLHEWTPLPEPPEVE